MTTRQPGQIARKHRAGGQAVVEFVFMLFPLILLAFGGLAIYEIERAQTIIDTAATEAARAVAATRPTVDGDVQLRLNQAQVSAENKVRKVMTDSGLRVGQPTVTVQADFGRAQAGEMAVAGVAVGYDYNLSLVSRMVLNPWVRDGVIRLKGGAYEPIPSYVSGR